MTCFSKIALLSCYLCICAGCVHHRITTYLSPEIAFPQSSGATRMAVSTQSLQEEPLLEKEVKRKLVKLITDRGYAIAEQSIADYRLIATFGIDNGVERVRSRAITNNGVTSYKTSSSTEYTRVLTLRLISLDVLRSNAPGQLDDAVCWSATTRSRGSSSDLRSMIDYLLIATMDYWGADTGKEVKNTLSKTDRRVKALDEF